MTPDEINELKQQMLKEIGELKLQIIDLVEQTKPIAPDCSIGRVTRMDAINNKGVNEHLLFRSKYKLKELEFNLSRISNVDYGKCKVCKCAIPVARLMMLPESDTCMTCA
jgi:DnaK suppressor protein